MTRWLWRLHHIGRRLWFPNLAGLVLLLAAVFFYTFWVDLEEKGLADDLTEFNRLQRVSKRVLPIKTTLPDVSVVLPDQSEVSILLTALNKIGKEQGVDLPEAEFNLTPMPVSGLLRLQLRYPVKADYLALCAFLAQSLNTLPSLVLDGFEFKRANIGITQLDAELRLSLYLRVRP